MSLHSVEKHSCSQAVRRSVDNPLAVLTFHLRETWKTMPWIVRLVEATNGDYEGSEDAIEH